MFTNNIDITSYADDATRYVSGVTLDSTVTWFNYSQMKRNEDKCHVMLSSQDNVHVKMGTAQSENS